MIVIARLPFCLCEERSDEAICRGGFSNPPEDGINWKDAPVGTGLQACPLLPYGRT